MKKIICFIFNHNHNENSQMWLDRLTEAGLEAYIIDSGSDSPMRGENIFTYENIYYGGCFMEMCKISREKNADFCLQINDDILIDDDNFSKLVKTIKDITEKDDIGVYQPSSTIDSHNAVSNNFNKGTNIIRKTTYIEGWMGLIHKDILRIIENVNKNMDCKLGWGIDVLVSYFSWMMNKMVVVDDNIIVKHPQGKAGYSDTLANAEMASFLDKNIGLNFGQIMYLINYLFKKKNSDERI